MGDNPSPPTGGIRARIAQRHFIVRVRQTSVARARNTVIEPWVDVRGDIAAILAGDPTRVGNLVVVNNRTYGIEASRTLYPIAGPGFTLLDRAAYKALGVYNELGDTVVAEEVLQRMHDQTLESRQSARAVYQAGRPLEP